MVELVIYMRSYGFHLEILQFQKNIRIYIRKFLIISFADSIRNAHYFVFSKYKLFSHQNGQMPLPINKTTITVYFVKVAENA